MKSFLSRLKPRSVYDVMALIACLGAVGTGTAYAANTIRSGDIVDGEVKTPDLANAGTTSTKLGTSAVTHSKIAEDAVTSSKVANNSLTASDVASGTFLAANGTATNASALGGVAASNFPRAASKRVVASGAANQTLFAVSTGTYFASCPSGKPTVTYQNASTAVDFAEQDFTSGGAFHFTTLNAVNGGGAASVASTNGNPFTSTIQTAAKSDARVVTAWVNGHVEGSSCIITGQAISTG